MSNAQEWDRGLLATNTVEFDRALHQLRRNASGLSGNPPLIADLANQLKEEPGITRREFDRRFRLIVSAIVHDDSAALQTIAIRRSVSLQLHARKRSRRRREEARVQRAV